tara:strand:- start:8963 stop:9454 length:492 start_codon:yes stop_codon:yes gene_type:complete
MANELRVRMSVDVLQDIGETTEGITYTAHQHDGNADARSWGGSYKISTVYDSAAVCYWKNAVVSATSADGLNNSGWTEASAHSDGSIPTTAHVVAVEYVRQSIGAASEVTVTVSAEIFAVLTPGESVVIPMHMGEAVASVMLHDANYANGSREAIVNVMMAGV